jgi:transcriptional regulator with XRE-family HTH domain
MFARLDIVLVGTTIRPVRPIYVDFGRKVRSARRTAGISQGELGRRIGLSRTSVTNVERGVQQVYVHTLCRIAKALDVAVAELVPDLAFLDGPAEDTPSMPLPSMPELPSEHRLWAQRVIVAPRRVDTNPKGGSHGSSQRRSSAHS